MQITVKKPHLQFTQYIFQDVKSVLCTWISYKSLPYQWVGLFFIYKLLVTVRIPTNIPILLQHKINSLIYAHFYKFTD